MNSARRAPQGKLMIVGFLKEPTLAHVEGSGSCSGFYRTRTRLAKNMVLVDCVGCHEKRSMSAVKMQTRGGSSCRAGGATACDVAWTTHAHPTLPETTSEAALRFRDAAVHKQPR